MSRSGSPSWAFLTCSGIAAASLWLGAPSGLEATELRWYKGNTHTHTLNSDGDSTPDEVVRWYREHGYQFVVLTDHNFLTSVDALNALHGADEQFLVIRGEELSDQFEGKPVHVNGLDVERVVAPQGGLRSSRRCSGTWTRSATPLAFPTSTTPTSAGP